MENVSIEITPDIEELTKQINTFYSQYKNMGCQRDQLIQDRLAAKVNLELNALYRVDCMTVKGIKHLKARFEKVEYYRTFDDKIEASSFIFRLLKNDDTFYKNTFSVYNRDFIGDRLDA